MNKIARIGAIALGVLGVLSLFFVFATGDDEIKMSELFKIKNKIQEAAGRNVNIIEGIGVDSDLGSAVSVTVVATGFEKKKRPRKQLLSI